MPNRAVTVSPVYSEDESGNQQLADFTIDGGHVSDVGRDGQVRDWEFDYQEDSEGRIHHLFSDVELESDKADQGVHFDEEEYFGALIESTPQLRPAQDWASENLSDELLGWYNSQIDSQDISDVNNAITWLLDQYNQRSETEDYESESEPVEEPDNEILSDEESTQFAEVLDTLSVQEPAGMEQAYEWLEAAAAHQKSDPVLSAVCQATADFHNSQASAEELIDALTSKFTPRQLAKAYQQIYKS